jgi:hypothetical protein
VSRAADNSSTPKETSFDDARRAPGWSEGKITDGIEGRKSADGTEVPPSIPWRGYSQEQGKDVRSDSYRPDFAIDTGRVDWDRGRMPVFWTDGDSDVIEGVRVQLPAEPASPRRGEVKRWVYARMQANPPRKDDREYVANLHASCPYQVKQKTIANRVSLYRKTLKLPR